jgi:ribosomal protein L7/L12
MSWYWLAAVAVVIGLGLISRRGERAGSKEVRPGGTPPSPATIDELLRGRQKIEAIKYYRAMHGVDLKTAKDAIDARARELGMG